MVRRHDMGDEQEPVFNLEDIIENREERRSAFADDVDNQDDIKIPDDIDVDDALTFPHPHVHRKKDEIKDLELMDTPREDDIDFDYDDSVEEALPTDYESHYNDAISTEATDDEDAVIEEIIDHAGDVYTADLLDEDEMIEPLPPKFHGEEQG
jgi:hypothetical protein